MQEGNSQKNERTGEFEKSPCFWKVAHDERKKWIDKEIKKCSMLIEDAENAFKT
jgi:hypothetical protein